jgi:hypothetical protein
MNGGAHGQACRQAVIDDNRNFVLYLDGDPALKKHSSPTLGLLQLRRRRPIQPELVQMGDFIRVSHDITIFGYGPDRVLGLKWMADLPNNNEIQRSFKHARHFNAKHNAAARQGINDKRLPLVYKESLSEFLTRVYPIQEHSSPDIMA